MARRSAGPRRIRCDRGRRTGGSTPRAGKRAQRLGVVGDLGRAEYARRDGKEERLEDRPGEHVRRDPRGAGSDFRLHAPRVLDAAALPVLDGEEREGPLAVRHGRLPALRGEPLRRSRGVPRACRFRAARRGGRTRRRAPRSSSESGSTTRSGSGSTRSKSVSTKASPYVRPGAYRAANAARVSCAVRRAGVLPEGREDPFDALRNRELSDGPPVGAVGALQDEGLGAVPSGPGRARDLLEVVVVGERPEDGRRRHAPGGQLARDADHVESLPEREQRPGEEADLVAGGHGHHAPRRELLRERRPLRMPRAERIRGDPRLPSSSARPRAATASRVGGSGWKSERPRTKSRKSGGSPGYRSKGRMSSIMAWSRAR